MSSKSAQLPGDAARAPLAVAASIGVMVAGAVFLSLVAARSPDTPAPAPARVDAATPAPKIAAAGPSLSETAPRPALAATPRPALATETLDAAAPANEDDGLTPSLSPARVAALADIDAVNTELAPRLKPAEKRAVAPAPAPMLTFGQVFLANADIAPPGFFFADDLNPDRAPLEPIAVAYAHDMSGGPRNVQVSLEKGETFVDAMRRAGVRAADRNAAAYTFGEYQNLRALRPGQEFYLTTSEPNRTLFQLADDDSDTGAYLLSLDFNIDPENRVSMRRDAEGGFAAQKKAMPLTSRLVAVNGRIAGSLYLSAKHAGAPDMVIANLADMFAYDVDFQREIRGGDEFEAIFEVKYDENGVVAGTGDILYGRLNWRGRQKEKGYYRFQQDAESRADYFDRAGDSARRLLMKTPIDGARLSSGFGTRHHPILGYARAHKGLDFAAPRGTPIKAAGSGKIERANRYGSFGNYIRIQHANGYETAYAHLKGFARGIAAGRHVSQGDIIAYVGTTGRSTGPHLHYEVHLNGTAVNPQNLKMATGVSLKGSELDRFKQVRDAIDAMRRPTEPEGPDVLAREDTAAKSSL